MRFSTLRCSPSVCQSVTFKLKSQTRANRVWTQSISHDSPPSHIHTNTPRTHSYTTHSHTHTHVEKLRVHNNIHTWVGNTGCGLITAVISHLDEHTKSQHTGADKPNKLEYDDEKPTTHETLCVGMRALVVSIRQCDCVSRKFDIAAEHVRVGVS